MCKEELHGGALDPPALGDAVEEPRPVVVHDKLEKGGGHWAMKGTLLF